MIDLMIWGQILTRLIPQLHVVAHRIHLHRHWKDCPSCGPGDDPLLCVYAAPLDIPGNVHLFDSALVWIAQI
jgi:hypothetical protein